jgi:protein-tyrosine phosphatase
MAPANSSLPRAYLESHGHGAPQASVSEVTLGRAGLADVAFVCRKERRMTADQTSERTAPEVLADRLVAATLAIGGNARAVRECFDHAGMPSEYRGGLAAARRSVESFLQRQNRGDGSSFSSVDERVDLAQNVVQLTHAIVFSMKHSLEYKLIFESGVCDLTARLKDIDPGLLDGEQLALRLERERNTRETRKNREGPESQEVREMRPTRTSPRTSESHPLRIDAMRLEAGGQIGMTIFPGRIDRLSPDGPWARSIAADLAVIEAWHPALVISLVEDFEFAMLGVPQFAAEMERFTWRHVPIVDGGVPNEAFEKAWRSVGDEARSALQRGERVVLHCRAGLGRTGMMAARLLVELGDPPEAAIRRVRAARRGTIETARQEAHVRATRPV